MVNLRKSRKLRKQAPPWVRSRFTIRKFRSFRNPTLPTMPRPPRNRAGPAVTVHSCAHPVRPGGVHAVSLSRCPRPTNRPGGGFWPWHHRRQRGRRCRCHLHHRRPRSILDALLPDLATAPVARCSRCYWTAPLSASGLCGRCVRFDNRMDGADTLPIISATKTAAFQRRPPGSSRTAGHHSASVHRERPLSERACYTINIALRARIGFTEATVVVQSGVLRPWREPWKPLLPCAR